jgi:hypothetical protein
MEVHKHACLNCGAIPIGAYCHACGQKSDTHRITLSHLIKHDLVHGIWHFDRGLLYTLREAFLRPGHMAIDYIKGRRVKYYNVFYLILVVIGINALTAHYLKAYYNIVDGPATKESVMSEDTINVTYFFDHYFKLLLFLLIPFFAISGLASFRRLKLNFAEHAIIAGSLLLTGAMWSFFALVGTYVTIDYDAQFLNYIVAALIAIVFLQPARVYYQAAGRAYKTGGFLLRVLLWYFCLLLLFVLLGLLIWALTGKTNFTFGASV